MKIPQQRKNWYLIAAYLCIICALPCQSRAQDKTSGADAGLVQQIDSILNIPALRAGWQGIVIKSLSDSTIFYTRNSDHVFLPASNNKLLTSAASLGILGPSFAFETRLYRTGDLDSAGTLHGDLTLVGSGDPLLTPDDLRDIAHQAYIAGIRRITGTLYYDDTRFDQQRLGDTWAWDDESYYYSAQISALNVNENIITIKWRPGATPGVPATLDVTPTARYTEISNKTITGPPKSKSNLSVDRLRGQNILVATGSVAMDATPGPNTTADLTIEDPARFAAIVFQDALKSEGVPTNSIQRVTDQLASAPERTLVAVHKSVELPAILKRLNKPSDNLVAECLLKAVGAHEKGKGTGGEAGTGAQCARNWFQSIGLDTTELNQADGSGLSRTNYVSPKNIVLLLTYLFTRPYFPALYDSLPIAGVDGSLRNRMKGTPAEGNCHAKTGYVSHASSLSGYVKTKDGETLVFSMLFNNHLAPNSVCTRAQDKIVALLAAYSRSSAGSVSALSRTTGR